LSTLSISRTRIEQIDIRQFFLTLLYVYDIVL
jgi:hypothetical protein